MTMQYRTPARLGRPLFVIGQGCWQLSSDWGEVTEGRCHGSARRRRRRRHRLLRHRRRVPRWTQRKPGRRIPGGQVP